MSGDQLSLPIVTIEVDRTPVLAVAKNSEVEAGVTDDHVRHQLSLLKQMAKLLR